MLESVIRRAVVATSVVLLVAGGCGVDNAGINADLACLNLGWDFPPAGQPRTPPLPSAVRIKLTTEEANFADQAGQDNKNYEPLARALDALAVAVRHRNSAETLAAVPAARRECAPLEPAFMRGESVTSTGG